MFTFFPNPTLPTLPILNPKSTTITTNNHRHKKSFMLLKTVDDTTPSVKLCFSKHTFISENVFFIPLAQFGQLTFIHWVILSHTSYASFGLLWTVDPI